MRPLLLLLALLAPALLPAEAGPWPQGKACAVSLTYDDALDSQIMNAAFDLDLRGLKGTFFLSGNAASVRDSAEAWKALAAKGHELGSHNMVHACSAAISASFLAPGDTLERYTLGRMGGELDRTLALLRSLGAKGPFTYAYPCGQDWVGEDHQSYAPLVKARFIAARGVQNTLADPARVDLYNTPGYDGSGKNAAGFLNLLAAARRQKAWLILMFHGVGGDHIQVSQDAHQALLDALQAAPDAWTAPFGEAAARVARFQGR